MFRVLHPTKSVNFRYKNNQLFIDFESANKVDTISLNKNIFNNKCLKLKNQGAFSLSSKDKIKVVCYLSGDDLYLSLYKYDRLTSYISVSYSELIDNIKCDYWQK